MYIYICMYIYIYTYIFYLYIYMYVHIYCISMYILSYLVLADLADKDSLVRRARRERVAVPPVP